uniref:Uncharacterized protein n=1 Tax=Ascaris lumbricoides TaxID=6252 RepID=A0A0M3IHI0_ASCLU
MRVTLRRLTQLATFQSHANRPTICRSAPKKEASIFGSPIRQGNPKAVHRSLDPRTSRTSISPFIAQPKLVESQRSPAEELS